MARAPDVVAEFVVGPTCPSDEELTLLAAQLSRNFLPDVGAGRRSAAVCVARDSVGSNVVTIGLWLEAEDDPEDQLRDELRQSDHLTAGRTIALFVPATSIRVLAELAWAATDKTIGRLTLGNTIEVDVGAGRIETVVNGSFDPPLFLPDVDFTNTTTETLDLAPAGSRTALEATTESDLDVSSTGLLVASLLAGILHPILGALVFFGAEAIAEGQAPDARGPGGALAAQWPTQIQTPVAPPFLRGKFSLTWSDLTVDDAGVLTLGTFTAEDRAPRVSITGRTNVSFREALGHGTARYGARVSDLRPPIDAVWSGVTQASGLSASLFLTSPGTRTIGVTVTDADGLSDSASLTVHVSVIPLEDGQQPF